MLLHLYGAVLSLFAFSTSALADLPSRDVELITLALESKKRAASKQNLKFNFSINTVNFTIILTDELNIEKKWDIRHSRFNILNLCHDLSLTNDVSRPWQVIGYTLEGKEIARCQAAPYRGPNAGTTGLYTTPPPDDPATASESERFLALFNDDRRALYARYELYGTAGQAALYPDAWLHTISLTYTDARSLAWALRDAEMLCRKLNAAGIAQSRWPLYVSITPDPHPVATCEVGPGGGKPLSPPAPALAANELPAERERALYILDTLVTLVHERAATEFVGFRDFHMSGDGWQRQARFDFIDVDNLVLTEIFFRGLFCEAFDDEALGNSERWTFIAYAEGDPRPFKICSTGG